MHLINKFIVISFYEFINLDNIEQLKIYFSDFLKKNNFKGTIILAKEGINGTVSCKNEKVISFSNFLNKHLKRKIKFKISKHHNHVFLRLKILQNSRIGTRKTKNILKIKKLQCFVLVVLGVKKLVAF